MTEPQWLSEFTFDEQDANLFQVPDTRLRAEALRHSILPRLHGIMNECIASIREVYGVEALEDSIVSYFPHFRAKRERELELLYDAAFVGLGGKRTKNKWFGFERRDGKPVQILPFRFALNLTEAGLGIVLENGWLKGLTDASFRKLFDFHLEHEPIISVLCFYTGLIPSVVEDGTVRPLSPLAEHYRHMSKSRYWANHFSLREVPYPIKPERLWEILHSYVVFYPVYDACIQIAKGEPSRFDEMIGKANDWLESLDNDLDDDPIEENPPDSGNSDSSVNFSSLAENKVRVMPALRWQVFQRDGWKCVACGRSAEHGILLHVDHIIPRSRGGGDALTNLQTLCNVCNLGKSNRDDTDLRTKR